MCPISLVLSERLKNELALNSFERAPDQSANTCNMDRRGPKRCRLTEGQTLRRVIDSVFWHQHLPLTSDDDTPLGYQADLTWLTIP
jgi:hypothetical protein